MITSIANVVVPVTDHATAIAFYRDTLGFRVVADFTPGPGFRWVELATPSGSTTVALATPRGGMWGSAGRDTNINLACTDAFAEHARLREAGVDVDDVRELGNGVPPMFRLRDGDGNFLQVVGDS